MWNLYYKYKKKEKRKNVDLLLNLGQYLNKTTRVGQSQGKDIDYYLWLDGKLYIIINISKSDLGLKHPLVFVGFSFSSSMSSLNSRMPSMILGKDFAHWIRYRYFFLVVFIL